MRRGGGGGTPTWRRHDSSHGESVSNALRHGNDIRNHSVALKAPHVASRSPEPGLDLREPGYRHGSRDGTDNNGCRRNNTPILLSENEIKRDLR